MSNTYQSAVLATIFLPVAIIGGAMALDIYSNGDKRQAACDDLSDFVHDELSGKEGRRLGDAVWHVRDKIFAKRGSASIKLVFEDVADALSSGESLKVHFQMTYSIGTNQWHPESAPIFNPVNPGGAFQLGSCKGSYSTQPVKVSLKNLKLTPDS